MHNIGTAIAALGLMIGSLFGYHPEPQTPVSGAFSPISVQAGGTGTTSPSGILYGDNGATNSLKTVTIGSNLTFSAGTLSATGGGSGGDPFTHPAAGQSATTSLMLLNGGASTTALTIGGWVVGTTTTVCPTSGQCNFTTIQAAINSGATDILVKAGTYAEQITYIKAKTKLRAESLAATIQCNGVTQSPCVSAGGFDEATIQGFTFNETNATLNGIAIDFSGSAIFRILDNRINNFATSTYVHDTTNDSFYGSIERNTFFNPKACMDFGGTQPNANASEHNRCRPMQVPGAFGLYLEDTRGFTSVADDFEATTTTGGAIGIFVNATSREIKITNPWVEANTTGISIASGANRVTIDGGSITSNGTDISDSGTNTVRLNTSKTGILDTNIGTATSTQFGISTSLYFNSDLFTDLTGSGLLDTSGALTCATANGSTFGCLSSSDWTTFNSKLGSHDEFTHPQAGTSATSSGMIFNAASSTFTQGLSIGFSTTTSATTTNLSVQNASTTNLIISSAGNTGCLAAGVGGVVTANGSACGSASGLASYDAWTHPAVGQSATTSLLLLNGAASSTLFSAYGPAYFGATATSSFSATGVLTVASAVQHSTGGILTFSNTDTSGHFQLTSGQTLNSSSGTDIFASIVGTIAQSGTAATNFIDVNPTLTSFGSGRQNLLALRGGGVEKFNFGVNGTAGFGTTTPQSLLGLLQLSTSTTQALVISDSSRPTSNHWGIANVNGVLNIGTSSPTTFATSTSMALSIDANGKITLPNLGGAGTGCVQASSAGLLSSTGAACGGTGSFPFTPTTNFGQAANATTTALWMQGSTFSLFASSTAVLTYATTSQFTIGTTTYLTETSDGWLKYKRTTGKASLLWVQSPDSDPQEATLTLDRVISAGNREFLDLTTESYSGVDRVFSLNLAKQGTGLQLPFILRFWNQDRGDVASTGWTSQAWLPNGSIGMGMATSSVSTNTLLHLASSTATYLMKVDAAPGTTKMYLDVNGQLGLGGVPSEILHLQKTTGNFTTMRFDSGTTQGYFFAYDGDNTVNLGSNSNASLNFKVNNSTKAMIDTTGYVGIASTTPTNMLSIGTTGSTYGSIAVTENKLATSTAMTIDWKSGNQQLVQLGASATTIGFNNASTSGQTLKLILCNPRSTASTVTMSVSSLLWTGGTAPTHTTTANKCDIYSFIVTQGTSTAASSQVIFGATTLNF